MNITKVLFFKDHMEGNLFLNSIPLNATGVIRIHSRSIRVIDAKLHVYREFEKDIKTNVLLQHELENHDQICRFSGMQKLKSLHQVLDSTMRSIPFGFSRRKLQNVADRVLSKEHIRNVCNNVNLSDGNIWIGSIHTSEYSCRSGFTVKRIKSILVGKTLNEIATEFGDLISQDLSNQIKSNVQRTLKDVFSKVQDSVSGDIFGYMQVIVRQLLIRIFDPLRKIIIEIWTFIVTFVYSVDVNSMEWRTEIADEIFNVVAKEKNSILNKALLQLELMCFTTRRDLQSICQQINRYEEKMTPPGHHSCKFHTLTII